MRKRLLGVIGFAALFAGVFVALRVARGQLDVDAQIRELKVKLAGLAQ